MLTNISIGLRLKEERLIAGFTQQQLADMTKSHRGSIGNYESGKRSIPADFLHNLKSLGFDPCYILTGRRVLEK